MKNCKNCKNKPLSGDRLILGPAFHAVKTGVLKIVTLLVLLSIVNSAHADTARQGGVGDSIAHTPGATFVICLIIWGITNASKRSQR